MLFQNRYYLNSEGVGFFLTQSYVSFFHLIDFHVVHMFDFFSLCNVKWGMDEEIVFSCKMGHLFV